MMPRLSVIVVSILLAVPIWWAMRPPETPLFTRLSAAETGVDFTNRIVETDSLHIFRYEYLYNGNGVGVGDFDGDGKPDLFFSGNTVPHKLYVNRSETNGKWQFTDVTKQAGVSGNGTWGTGVSVVDINGDGRLDIYVCHSGKFGADKLVNELFINEGVQRQDNGPAIPHFSEQARQYGLDLPGTQTTQAAFLDYDRDGDLDAFILNHSNHTFNPLLNTRKLRATPDMRYGNRLLRNDGGKFTDVTLAEGILNNPINFGLGVGVADVDNDGWPDLYTTSDYTEQDCLYLNQHDALGRHTGFKESIRTSMAHTSKFSMGCDIADYNNDTLPDIVTLDMLPADNHRQKMLKGPDEYDAYKLLIDSGYVRQQMRNMLQLNQGTDAQGALRFSEIGQLAGVSATDWSWSALLADFDNDGWKDLFVSNGYLRDFTDMDFMKYTVADAKLEEAAKGNLNFQTLDLVKKMPSNRLSSYVFRNNHDLTFSNQSAAWGIEQPAVSGAAAYADFDGDGDLDLVVCHQNEPASLYRNNADQQSDVAHSLRVRLVGAGANTQALGARVVVETATGRQLQTVSPTRGYQASVETTLHFGLGRETSIKRLTVYWPDGRQTQQLNPSVDQTLMHRQSDAQSASAVPLARSVTPWFRPLPMASILPFQHRENDFIDFKVEVLIPYQLSRLGPALAAGDVNGDGRDDLYLGGAVGQSGELWVQQANGTFVRGPQQPWQAEAAHEDVNALFFDADRDGDVDLYVVSGGNEYEAGSPEYQDRLYLNDGRGGFGPAVAGALPTMRDSKMAVAAADVDGDGDQDLFVGGRGKAGSFPLPSASYLLRNDTPAGGAVRFTDVTEEVAPACRQAGMVQAAAWADLNGDKQPDLVLAGDWMPVRVFYNQRGKLTDQTKQAGLGQSKGMWASLRLADVDQDGDTDIVAGNAGLNNPFRASLAEPMSVVAGDIDQDGVLDPVWVYYVQGKAYPAASRDELLDQVVPLRKRFSRYHQYADATVETIFGEQALANATTVEAFELASGVFVNQGNGQFSFAAFPLEAQFSRASSLLIDDWDGDGKSDVLVAGNFHPYRVQHGPCDASFGVILRGDGRGKFSAVAPRQSGLWAGGDVRTGVQLRTSSGRKRVLFTVNDGPLIGFER
ncbi:ASPIC/UnbV domain protein [Fibrisoma limi BUZ 3]|uniref:ASPIC/UnbV domain protein n=1 Tax=Fibrisoma limi BUZ 3 TaxID=1185876 RepID=I2GDQ3_9BACT|nr:VCBS repeat-containing protein [Fibrisoma limi]CCH52027.1 ASPIC/UnbV domain protein [Fibrisoma limi BUZ 3]